MSGVGTLPATPVVILTGPIQSGKTTALVSWIAERRASGARIGGVLAPVTDGKRHLRSIANGEERILDVAASDGGGSDADVVAIGPHRFYADVFAWARAELLSDLDSVGRAGGCEWVVIDEVGPLELRDEGLEPAVGEALRICTEHDGLRVLLVVRDRLLADVTGRYGLADPIATVIDVTDLSAPISSI